MDPERRRQVEALYQAARDRSPEDRAVLLSTVSAELRGVVEALLAHDAAAGGPATSRLDPAQPRSYKVQAPFQRPRVRPWSESGKLRDRRLRRRVPEALPRRRVIPR